MSQAGEELAGTPASPSRARLVAIWRRIDLPLLVVATAFAYRGLAMTAPLRSTIPAVERFFFHPSQNAPDVTLLAMVALILADWKRLVARIGRERPHPLGALALPLALALHLWSFYTQALQVDLLSLGLFLIGACLVLGGVPMARLILLPASLLLVAIPVPVVLINAVVPTLQAGTITLATSLLALIGQGYQVAGDVIYCGGRAFQVVDTCTGLRSLSTMLMATLVYIRLFRKQGWRAALLIVVAGPIAFLFNGLRVVTIILSAEMTLVEDHTIQGIVVMVAGVLTLHALAQGVDRLWPPPPSSPLRMPRGRAPRDRRVAAVLLVLLALCLAPLLVTPWKAAPGLTAWTIKMPTDWEGYKARRIRLDTHYYGSVEFDRHLQRRYERDGEPPVDVLLGMQRRVGRDQSLLSAKLGVPGSAQVLLADGSFSLPDLGIEGRVTMTRGAEGTSLNYSWFRGTAGLGVELLRAFFALDHSCFHRPEGAYALRVSTPVDSESDLPAARERLHRFAGFLEGLLPEAVRAGGS